jgi:hypothetical protein
MKYLLAVYYLCFFLLLLFLALFSKKAKSFLSNLIEGIFSIAEWDNT